MKIYQVDVETTNKNIKSIIFEKSVKTSDHRLKKEILKCSFKEYSGHPVKIIYDRLADWIWLSQLNPHVENNITSAF